jgi:divalent metal cation (Fe/Co/Zn/Cd) transporter
LVLPPKSSGRQALIREAFRLEWLTIGWMTVEAVIAIASGVAAGSLVLMAFGLDSVIELASAGVLMWRLSVELRRGQAFSEDAERTASRIAGGLLFALAAYVTIAALWSLWTRQGEGFSWPGLAVALAAIPAMRYLAHRKIAIADKLGSRALRADAMEAVTCGWLSAVVVVSAPLNGRSAHGGSMASASSRSFGCWSKRVARLGPIKSAVAVRCRWCPQAHLPAYCWHPPPFG